MDVSTVAEYKTGTNSFTWLIAVQQGSSRNPAVNELRSKTLCSIMYLLNDSSRNVPTCILIVDISEEHRFFKGRLHMSVNTESHRCAESSVLSIKYTTRNWVRKTLHELLIQGIHEKRHRNVQYWTLIPGWTRQCWMRKLFCDEFKTGRGEGHGGYAHFFWSARIFFALAKNRILWVDWIP
jgi:hypothetical protein